MAKEPRMLIEFSMEEAKAIKATFLEQVARIATLEDTPTAAQPFLCAVRAIEALTRHGWIQGEETEEKESTP